MIERVHGRYVGLVVDNVDPKNLCRVRVTVPEVLADQESGWCRPVTPYAGDGVGFAAVPPVGSLVLIEWPGGDVSREPLWSGATWSDGGGVEGAGPDAIIIETPGGHRIEIRDNADEKVEIVASNGSSIVMDSSGMTLTFGSQTIAMTNQSVSINDGALEIR